MLNNKEEIQKIIVEQLRLAVPNKDAFYKNLAGLIITELDKNFHILPIVWYRIDQSEDWDKIGSEWIKLDPNMGFLNWLKQNYYSPYKLPSTIHHSMAAEIKETESILEKAKAIHGDGYTYERREGTEVDLSKLKPNQRVCAGGNEWHILMTER